MNASRIVTAMVLVGLCAMATSPAESYRYRVTTGKEQSVNAVSLTKDATTGNVTVESVNTTLNVSHHIILDPRGASLSWVYTHRDGTVASFVRNENTVSVSDGSNGKNPSVVPLDGDPWFASIDYGLEEFVSRGTKDMTFWTVNPENLKPFKMKAERMKTEKITCNGAVVSALHVRVTADGVPAFFFSMQYWFRPSDSAFLRFEGTQGGPGSPKTVIELISEEK